MFIVADYASLSIDISTSYINTKSIAWIDVLFMVKDINVIIRKNKTILILISLNVIFRILKDEYLA